MSVYKCIVTRCVLPHANRCFKNKQNFVSIWTINNHINKKNHSTYTGKRYYSYANSIQFTNQFRSIHLSSVTNKIVPFNLSDIGEGIREVVVKEWYIKVGDKVAQFDNICEVQSDKASVTITSRYDGVITKLHHQVDEIALVGKPLFDVDIVDDSPEEPLINENNETKEKKIEQQISKPVEAAQEYVNNESEISSKVFAIPSVRRLAKENKIKLTDVKGTGKDGRILKEDILKYIEKKSQPMSYSNVQEEEITIEPVRGYTRAMIKTMTEAVQIPQFVLHEEVVVTNLAKLRIKIKRKFEEINVPITYMPFFIKAMSNALSRYPIINSRLDENKQNIIYYKSHNIGFAMDTPSGLAVPVVKNVQNKDIVEISRELTRLIQLGKQSKFSQDDLSDGTITFSNIGAIGGTYAKPIILPPQSSLIALGSFKTLPRFAEDGSIIRETIGYLSAAGDHRIIDGATMARFCNHLKEQIEDPEFLLMNL